MIEFGLLGGSAVENSDPDGAPIEAFAFDTENAISLTPLLRTALRSEGFFAAFSLSPSTAMVFTNSLDAIASYEIPIT